MSFSTNSATRKAIINQSGSAHVRQLQGDNYTHASYLERSGHKKTADAFARSVIPLDQGLKLADQTASKVAKAEAAQTAYQRNPNPSTRAAVAAAVTDLRDHSNQISAKMQEAGAAEKAYQSHERTRQMQLGATKVVDAAKAARAGASSGAAAGGAVGGTLGLVAPLPGTSVIGLTAGALVGGAAGAVVGGVRNYGKVRAERAATDDAHWEAAAQHSMQRDQMLADKGNDSE